MRDEDLILDALRTADVGVERGLADRIHIDEPVADGHAMGRQLFVGEGVGIARIMLQIERVEVLAHAAWNEKAAFARRRLIDYVAGDRADIVDDHFKRARPQLGLRRRPINELQDRRMIRRRHRPIQQPTRGFHH